MAVIDTIEPTKVTTPTFLRDGKLTNGKLPIDILRCPDLDRSSTSAYWRLFAPVSWAMTALQIAAKADGIAIPVGNPNALGNDNIVDTTGRYRSYEQQENLFRSRYATSPPTNRGSKLWDSDGNGVVERWYNQRGAMAAVPGTSNHGWGLADDVAEDSDQFDGTPVTSIDERTLAWMRDNAPDFGWGLETRKEAWHWHWIGGDALSQRVMDTLYEAGVMPPDNLGAEYGFTVPVPTQLQEDDEVTHDELVAAVREAIAAEREADVNAQYDEMLIDPSVNKETRARDLFRYTRGAAANADVATRKDTGWIFKTLGGIASDVKAILAKLNA